MLIQEGDDLPAGAAVIGAEGGGTGAGGDVVPHCPQHGTVEVIPGRHIPEGIAAADGGDPVAPAERGSPASSRQAASTRAKSRFMGLRFMGLRFIITSSFSCPP